MFTESKALFMQLLGQHFIIIMLGFVERRVVSSSSSLVLFGSPHTQTGLIDGGVERQKGLGGVGTLNA